MQEETNAFGDLNPADIPPPEQIIAANLEAEDFARSVFSINAFPAYVPEEQNEDILIRGRWLERGGSAWWISTAGTGKSIASVQLAYKWGNGQDFAGLQPHRPLRSWIIQSEDSPSRVTIDREDIVAELMEHDGEIDWHDVGERMVKFVNMTGKVGAAFLEELDRLLALATKFGQRPDVVIINPFMAFVGGPVTDGGYVTPFLRGGEICNRHTDGLQAILERHAVATLIFHHTPKPPTEKEIDAWLKSMFPEYQGAGSSDITNWGRSFVTMMKVRNHARVVCMVAGKNGGEIGWEEIGGSRRRYMAWSDGTSITGGGRHAWRDLTPDEYDEIVGRDRADADGAVGECVAAIVEAVKRRAMNQRQIETAFAPRFPRKVFRPALAELRNNYAKYRLTRRNILVGRAWCSYLGLAEGLKEVEAEVKGVHADENAETAQALEAETERRIETELDSVENHEQETTYEEENCVLPF